MTLCYIHICIYIIYTPNLGFNVAVSGQEREQGRFRGAQGAQRDQGGAWREHQRSTGEHRGSIGGLLI